MEVEYVIRDPTQLLDAASEFAYNPGAQSDDSTKDFLDRFPLPVLICALQTKGDMPGLENALVTCLERIFKTRYGASLIPQYMPFVVVGLGAESQKVRCVACKIVSCFLENPDQTGISATDLLIQRGVYPHLLKCLIEGDEQVATAAMDAIKILAGCTGAMEIIFPANVYHPTHLTNVAAECSSLGRVRILALIVKLFSISTSVASAVYNSNLLGLLEAEVSNEKDTLATLSVLELFYELAEVQHSTQFLSRTTLVQPLSSLISNPSSQSMLRARAMMIIGRLMSKENVFSFIDETSVKTVISAIDGRLGLDNLEADECECAIEALGQIGTTIEGAMLLLSGSPPAARHVVHAAFGRNGHGKKLAALHAFGNIAGETRSESNRLLNANAEEILKHLVYETASKSSKFSPSGLLLSVLQMESEIRLAGYRLITGLAARSWCLMEICSRQEIINIVTDTFAETAKIGMEGRHKCCEAILTALSTYPNLQSSDPALAGVAAKLDEAVRRGPYLALNKRPEAQPVVMTAERF